MAKVYIGTSGWVYKEWGKTFFPEGLPQSRHLNFLSEHFNTVEVNASFYHLMPLSNYEKWRAETPADFRFAVKVSRYITHVKRMNIGRREWNRFFRPTRGLKNKRGPLLLQFPSFFTGKVEEIRHIDHFFEMVKQDGRLRFAVEFRHDNCFSKGLLEVLEKHRAALVMANSSRYPTAPEVSWADFVYFRLHGPRKMFASGYSDDELKPWARLTKKYFRQGKNVYIYFNNDMHANAVVNAKMLQKISQFPRYNASRRDAKSAANES